MKLFHLRKCLEILKQDDLALCPRVNEKTLGSKHFDKMRTQTAINLFGIDVASAIKFLIRENQLDKKTTAWLIEFICKWHTVLTAKLPECGFLPGDREFEANQSFLRQDMKIGNGDFKPVQIGSILSITSALKIQQTLFDIGFKFVLPARFLSDAVENTFSQLCHKNPVPSSLEFASNIRVITLNQYLMVKNSTSYNIDEDAYFIVDYFEIGKKELSSLQTSSKVEAFLNQPDFADAEEEADEQIQPLWCFR